MSKQLAFCSFAALDLVFPSVPKKGFWLFWGNFSLIGWTHSASCNSYVYECLISKANVPNYQLRITKGLAEIKDECWNVVNGVCLRCYLLAGLTHCFESFGAHFPTNSKRLASISILENEQKKCLFAPPSPSQTLRVWFATQWESMCNLFKPLPTATLHKMLPTAT